VADFDRVETGADGTITAIQSTKRGTETVKLCTPVPTAGRPILEWLQALLAEVPSTMAQLFTASYKEGDTTPLLQLKAPQATTLLNQQVRFTALVEAALRAGDLTQLESNMEATIADLHVAAEPSSQWNMAKTLMTLAVAQLNTVRRLLEMAATEPFDEVWRTWHSYIRHYTTADNTVVVRCNEEEIPYGYHYVNRDILVKTPLTHLAYQTSMAATKAGVVFAHGPAGTGKTETQKDFAQIELGYPAYVFNCSEKMDETSFMKIREAAEALPHAMFIFDEANCCQRELLEEFVAAVKKLASPRLLPVAFTYNPAWDEVGALAGVSEGMPQVAMTIPDYTLIVEVLLATQGFTTFTPLSARLVKYFTWCKENLSKHAVYDFGLRNIKATTNICGALYAEASTKHQPTITEEAIIIARAIYRAVIPRCTAADTVLAEAELGAAFPEVELSSSSFMAEMPRQLRHALQRASEHEAIQGKLAEFVATSQVRHGLCALTEKPRETVQSIATVGALTGRQVVYMAAPHTGVVERDMALMYGEVVEGEGEEWVDGTFPAALRLACQNTTPTWLLVDGGDSMDAALLEPLHTLLDDNKFLILKSGERIKLAPSVQIVFVLNHATLADSTPASISRMGVVNFEVEAPRAGWFW